LSPDNAVFVKLAKIYAENHKIMSTETEVCGTDYFPGGITNGAHWYNVRGMIHANLFKHLNI